MMLAIAGRYRNDKGESSFQEKYGIVKYFRDVFDELDVLLFPVISEKNLERVCELCEGLILPGSSIDIDPKYYGQEPVEGTNLEIDEYRLDQRLIRLFAEAGKPILGICGGLQGINVYFGGDLHQNIENHFQEDGSTHKIQIEPDSFLGKTYQVAEMEINSFHHQAVRRVAPRFLVTARSGDGVIEAIENGNIVGVQWHPERERDLKFFQSFLERFF